MKWKVIPLRSMCIICASSFLGVDFIKNVRGVGYIVPLTRESPKLAINPFSEACAR